MSTTSATATVAQWLKLEQSRVAARRALLNKDLADSATGRRPPPLTGLALSGGGIRSATLSLGTLQALAQAQVLLQFDYLSTVSGGGYAGSFLGSLLMPQRTRQGEDGGATDAELMAGAQAGLTHLRATEQNDNAAQTTATRPISWLRHSGRYLAPNGGGDVWYAFTMWLRNLLAVHYVLGLSLVCLLVLLGLANEAMQPLLTAALQQGGIQAEPGWNPGLLFALLALLVLALALLPLGIAYWYTEMPKSQQPGWLAGVWTRTFVVGALMGPALWAAWRFWGQSMPLAWQDLGVQAIAAWLLLAALWYLAAWTHSCLSAPLAHPMNAMQVTRTRLTRWLSLALGSATGLAVIAGVMVVCQWLLQQLQLHPWHGMGAAGLTTALLGVWKLVPKKIPGLGQPQALQWLPLLGAVALGILLILGWGMVAALLVGGNAAGVSWFIVLSLFPFAYVTGESFQFLNLSTIQNLYTARIVRAYLGATNSDRARASGGQDMTEPHVNDDLSLARYYGSQQSTGKPQLASLAPLHLINITINETVAPKGSLVNQDRKGVPLTVTPDGYLVNGKFHLRHAAHGHSGTDFELMSLGRWIGISGAAFAPGLGRGTRAELSMLMVLANVRLGYWWKASVAAMRAAGQSRQWPFSTQLHLWRELRAHFYGQADSHWYLSDGGHFENTGVYELLRRRLDFILALDNGADPSYQFADIANLMRLASVDLGASFTPLTGAGLKQKLGDSSAARLADLLGDPHGFASDPGQASHFLMAYQVSLPPTDDFAAHTTSLLWIKPRLTQESSLDLRQYQATHPAFPQESTADQFFDDQQWESYRKLGQQAGQALIDPALRQDARDGALETLLWALRS